MEFKKWITLGIFFIALMIGGVIFITNSQSKADTDDIMNCTNAGLFQDANYDTTWGAGGCFQAATYNNLTSYDLYQNISSVQARNGYQIVLYTGANLTGSSITLTSDVANLTTKNFDNQAVSAKVIAPTAPEEEDEELHCDTVGVYSESYYGDMGAAWCVPVGSYTNLEKSDLEDNISSVKVSSGYKVTLYKDKNYSGASLELTTDTPSLATRNFANVTSSLKVEKVATSCSEPLSETRTQACPEGQTGSITQTRSKSAAPSCSWGDWAQTASTCVANTTPATTTEPAAPAASSVTNPSGTAPTLTVTPEATNPSSASSAVPTTESATSNRWVAWLIVGGGLLGLTIGIFFWIKRRPI